MAVEDISVSSRNTQGVHVLTLNAGDAIADVARMVIEDDDEALASSTDESSAPEDATLTAPDDEIVDGGDALEEETQKRLPIPEKGAPSQLKP